MFQFERSEREGVTVLTLVGNLDAATSAGLKKEVVTLTDGGKNRVAVDMAKVSPEPGGHVVYDLNSANGTFVNEIQVKRQKLSPGDVVRFGPFSFKFESEAIDRTGPIKVGKFMEVHTQVGSEPPSKIIDSLD